MPKCDCIVDVGPLFGPPFCNLCHLPQGEDHEDMTPCVVCKSIRRRHGRPPTDAERLVIEQQTWTPAEWDNWNRRWEAAADDHAAAQLEGIVSETRGEPHPDVPF